MKKKSSANDPLSFLSLYGIVCNLKEYKLAFLINKYLNLEMERKEYEEDVFTQQQKITFFFATDELFDYFLFRNVFMPEFFQKKFRNIDYFLLLHPHLPMERKNKLIPFLSKSDDISACLEIKDEACIRQVMMLLRLSD